MSHDLRQLTQRFTSAINEGHGALFIGAGMSRGSGYVDWRGFIKRFVLEMGLGMDHDERDPAEVTQHYLNSKSGDRTFLHRALIDELDKPGTPTPSHRIIARLPIPTIWTTNFDMLIEDALKANRKTIDVKARDADLGIGRKRDLVLYKMHGDVARPDEIIICKSDYECYRKTHPIFQNTLEGDLLTKTFLFLGFSFSDPNLNYVLGQMRSTLEQRSRVHYAVMRSVRKDFALEKRDPTAAQRQLDDERLRQEQQIKELYRYGIETVLIKKYREVRSILKSIEREIFRKTVCVLGAFEESRAFTQANLADFCNKMVCRLIDEDFKLVTDLGRNVGDSIVDAVMSKLEGTGESAIDNHLVTKPCPRYFHDRRNASAFNRERRKALIAGCRFVILIGGTNTDWDQLLDDFESARTLKKVVIPIGPTGSGAEQIWRTIQQQFRVFYPDAVSPEVFEQLNDSRLDNQKLVDAVFRIIESVCEWDVRPSRYKGLLSVTDVQEIYYKLEREYQSLTQDELEDIIEEVTGIWVDPPTTADER
jgi:SLOG family protein/SIR2-like protein